MARFAVSLPARINPVQEMDDSLEHNQCSCTYLVSRVEMCMSCILKQLEELCDSDHYTKEWQERTAWEEHLDDQYIESPSCYRHSSGWDRSAFWFADERDCYACYLENPDHDPYANSYLIEPPSQASQFVRTLNQALDTWLRPSGKPAGRGIRSGAKHWKQNNGGVHDPHNRLSKLKAARRAAAHDFRQEIAELI